MSVALVFPSLNDFTATRRTLQLYSRAVAAIPRAYAEPHPQWWHVSLNVRPDGLVTDTIVLPDGVEMQLKMDLEQHEILLVKGTEVLRIWDMATGLTSTTLGDQIINTVEALGLTGGDYGREKFADDEIPAYDPDSAAKFLIALTNADRIFKAHSASLSGKVSPVQLWPHGFDLAFEWYGTRVQIYEEHGAVQEAPAQLNLGFYPEDTGNAYFYSNPWPFEADILLDKPLPEGASWHTEGWQGATLPYAELADDPDGENQLYEFARAVYDLAAPTLMAT